jgi:hypothetical protein
MPFQHQATSFLEQHVPQNGGRDSLQASRELCLSRITLEPKIHTAKEFGLTDGDSHFGIHAIALVGQPIEKNLEGMHGMLGRTDGIQAGRFAQFELVEIVMRDRIAGRLPFLPLLPPAVSVAKRAAPRCCSSLARAKNPARICTRRFPFHLP